jgi:hypothetical protein
MRVTAAVLLLAFVACRAFAAESTAPNPDTSKTAEQAAPSPPSVFDSIAASVEGIHQSLRDPANDARDDADLKAQQGMEKWARKLFGVSVLQAIIGLGGTIALIFTIRQGRRSLDIGRGSLEAAKQSTHVTVARDRAFVFVDDIVFELRGSTIVARVKWKNGGTTPTKGFRTHVSTNYFVLPRPDQFTFQDYGKAVYTRALVGPQSIIESGPLPIDPEGARIAERRHRDGDRVAACTLIWGWCEYNDVFPGTPRHRTEFCREVILADANQNIGRMGIRTFPVFEFNNTDDECLHPIKTVPEKDG